MTALSNANIGACSTVAWNCADRRAFRGCELATGDEVQVVASYFGSVIIRVRGKLMAVAKEAADRIPPYESRKWHMSSTILYDIESESIEPR